MNVYSSRGHALFSVVLLVGCGSSDSAVPDSAAVVDAAYQADAPTAMDTHDVADGSEAATDAPAPADAPDPTMDQDAGSDADTPDGGVGCHAGVFGAAPPRTLSASGCFDPEQPGTPVAAFFPYDVNSPLWSDGAAKSRFFLIPPGSTLKVKDCDAQPALCRPVDQGGTPEDEGHFAFPEGSILVKNFALEGRLIETRVLALPDASAGWRAYSYEWNADATEAYLLDDGKDRMVGAQTWHYPSEVACMQCHTAAAGRTLGPSVQQLDRSTANGNPLDRLIELGWLPSRPKKLAPFTDPKLPGPAAPRARSYLAANCAHCHRPDGPFSDLDLRYAATLLEIKACNVPILRGSYDPALPPMRIVPGAPEQSSLSFRMHDREGYAMPKIGSNLVDPDGTAVVDQWIREMTACPTAEAP